MSQQDQLHQFVRGLHPSIASMVTLIDAKTLEEATNIAVRFGATAAASSSPSSSSAGDAMDLSNIEGLDQDTDDGTDTPVTQKQLMQLLAAMQERHRSGGGDAPKAPYVPRGLPVIKGMTPQQVKVYMDAGKCFRCGSTEHRSRGCSKPIN